jgi:hypothetical protein
MSELTNALANIKRRKEEAAEELAANIERVKHRWQWAQSERWIYQGHDIIRGQCKYSTGLPHVFKNTAPRWLLSKNELTRFGLKPKRNVWPVCHTYNEQAGLHSLYDIRDCTMIGGPAAKGRLLVAIDRVLEEMEFGLKNGRDLVLEILQEYRDVPF